MALLLLGGCLFFFERRKLISFGGEGQWDLEGSWCFGACLGADLRASL